MRVTCIKLNLLIVINCELKYYFCDIIKKIFKMKKILFIVMVAVSLGVSAQIEAGKLMIGGSFGFGSSSGETSSTVGNTTNISQNPSILGFNFLPQAGYLLTENLGVGVGMGYNYSRITTPNAFVLGPVAYNNIETEGMFVFSPFGRYYKNTGDKAYAFAEFAMPMGVGSSTDLRLNSTRSGVEQNDPTRILAVGVQLSIGFNYFLNDKCALEAKWAGLNFQTRTETQSGTVGNIDWKNKDKTNDLSFGFNMTSISIGLRIFL